MGQCQSRSGIYKSLLTFTWSSCYPRDKVHISGCCEIQCMCSRVTITLEHKERKDISPWQCGQGSLGGNLGRALCSAYWVKRRILAIEFHREAWREEEHVSVSLGWWSSCETKICFLQNVINRFSAVNGILCIVWHSVSAMPWCATYTCITPVKTWGVKLVYLVLRKNSMKSSNIVISVSLVECSHWVIFTYVLQLTLFPEQMSLSYKPCISSSRILWNLSTVGHSLLTSSYSRWCTHGNSNHCINRYQLFPLFNIFFPLNTRGQGQWRKWKGYSKSSIPLMSRNKDLLT